MQDAASRIGLLTAWRRGAAAAGLCCGGFLTSGLLGTLGSLAGFAIAVCIMGAAEIALLRFLRRCALCPELAAIPAVARHRDRLCSVRRRRLLARSLRRTALAPPRAQASPLVRWDRVALVRDELLALADELEWADTVDPRTMVELRELLCSGLESPLLNQQLPASELVSAVRCARFRLVTATLRRSIRQSAVSSVAPVPAPDCDRQSTHGRPSALADDEDAPAPDP